MSGGTPPGPSFWDIFVLLLWPFPGQRPQHWTDAYFDSLTAMAEGRAARTAMRGESHA